MSQISDSESFPIIEREQLQQQEAHRPLARATALNQRFFKQAAAVGKELTGAGFPWARDRDYNAVGHFREGPTHATQPPRVRRGLSGARKRCSWLAGRGRCCGSDSGISLASTAAAIVAASSR